MIINIVLFFVGIREDEGCNCMMLLRNFCGVNGINIDWDVCYGISVVMIFLYCF